MAEEELHNILVRGYSTEQKKAVETAATKQGTSTNEFIRNASVKAAGGKLEKREHKKPGRKPGSTKGSAQKAVPARPVMPQKAVAPVRTFKKPQGVFALPTPFFRNPKLGRL